MSIEVGVSMEVTEVNERLNNFEKLTEERTKVMQEDISEIKETLKKLPDEIADKLKENTDLRIKLEVQALQSKMLKWVCGLAVGFIGELVMLIIQWLKK